MERIFGIIDVIILMFSVGVMIIVLCNKFEKLRIRNKLTKFVLSYAEHISSPIVFLSALLWLVISKGIDNNFGTNTIITTITNIIGSIVLMFLITTMLMDITNSFVEDKKPIKE